MAKSISDLPAELMMHIFEQVKVVAARDLVNSTLISCAQVNRQWNAAANRVIWKSLEFQRRSQLQSLIQVLQSCHDGKTMHDYRRHVQQVSVGHFLSRSINDQDIRQLFEKLSAGKLKRLNLGHCMNLTDDTMQLIADTCPELESFSIEAKTGQQNFNKHTIDSVLMRCRRLKEVGFFNSSQIDDDTMAAMTRHCPNLTKLMLVFCENVGDASIDSIVSNCRQLETIYITSDTITETPKIHELARRCQAVYISIRQQRPQQQNQEEAITIYNDDNNNNNSNTNNNNGDNDEQKAQQPHLIRRCHVKLIKNAAASQPLHVEYQL